MCTGVSKLGPSACRAKGLCPHRRCKHPSLPRHPVTRRHRSDVDVVITSGGVGPTLDDVTMEAVAQAFGTNLIRRAEGLGLGPGLASRNLGQWAAC